MSEGKNGDLLRVAQAVSDGIPVAWDEESKSRPDLAAALAELRGIEAMVAAQLEPEALLQTREISPSASSPSRLWGRLRLLELLGQGGYGEVYRAHDPVLQVDVALKLYRPSSVGDEERASRLVEEARRLARIRHPNVVILHGADRHGGEVGIWMELVRGRTLEKWIAEQGPLGAEEAARVGRDLCRALAAVHAAGLVHQDVKTQNVMREEGGRIVLMDFGAGVALTPAAALVPERVVGTPIVMAPEVLRGLPATRASDLYSLGVLLYRLVTRRYPIEADTLSELRERQAAGAVTPLRDLRPDLPVEFLRVVEKAMALDPAERFASAGEMERSLSGPSIVESRARPARTWRTWAVASAAAVVAVAAVYVLFRKPSAGVPSADRSAVVEPPPVSNPPATAVAAPLAASAKLYRTGPGGDERLFPGSRVRPGDDLVLEFESPERVYLYVLDQDEAGNAFVLFPAPGLDGGNPLAAHVHHRLPGTRRGEPASWEVSSAHGKESVFAIASRTPLRVLERDIASFPHASPSQTPVYGELGDSTLLALRGIGKIAVHVAAPAVAKRPRLEGALRDVPGDASGVWSWEIEMENPER